jgi:hypothetical protein
MFELGLEANSDFVHILDTDIGLSHDTAARLMARDVDIVSSPLYFYDPANNDIHLNVHYSKDLCREYTPRMPPDGIERIFATAFGSVMIKHRVLETFKQANESFCSWTDFLAEEYKTASPDTIFFLKAQEFGFEVWMDWSIPIGTHHKYARINSTMAEKFYVQRYFDVVYGPEEKNAMFQTPEGREHLKSSLQHHYNSGLARRSSGGSNPNELGPQGTTTAGGTPPVREDASSVPEPVGVGETPATPDGGGDS